MATNQPVLERTEGVYRELRTMRRHFRVGSWITLIVGGLLLLLVMAYFTIGYREISSFRDPDLIVSLVGSMAEQQIPAMRKTAEDQVKNNASQWAEQASKQVIELIPQGREQLESLALQQSDEMIARIDEIGEKYFHEVLDQNRELVQNAINQLKADDEISEGAVIAIREAIEKQFEIDGDNQAAALVTIASDINKNLDKLAAGENLSREQKAERRVLMLARQIHFQQFGDVTLDHIADKLDFLDAASDHLEEQEMKRLREERAEQDQDSKEALVEVAKVDSQKAPEAQPAAKPEAKKEEVKPAEKPEAKKAEEKKPAETKVEEPAKAAEKPEAKKEAPAEEKKPAEAKKEEAKPAEKPEAKPAEEKKAEEPAKAEEKPEAKKEAPAEEKKPAEPKAAEEKKEEPKPEEKKAEG